MDVNFVFNIQTLLGIICFGIVTKWYVWPRFKMMTYYEVLTVLMVIYGFRFMGMFFAVQNMTAGLNPAFGTPGAWNDMTISIISILAAFALHYRKSFGVVLAWIVTIGGIADFAYNGSHIVPLMVPQTIGPLMPLMTVLGPLWMVSTVVNLIVLIKKPMQS